MKTDRLIIGVGLVVFAMSRAAAEEIVASADYRDRTDAAGSAYYVVFCAREHDLAKGTVGHAWVMWCADDPDDRVCRIDRAYGFWPADGKGKFSVVDVPGRLVDELLDPKKRQKHFGLSHRLIVRVNAEAYRKSQQAIRRWETDSPDYNILRNSCKHFVSDVARDVGIEAVRTEPTDWPETHLIRLISRVVERERE